MFWIAVTRHGRPLAQEVLKPCLRSIMKPISCPNRSSLHFYSTQSHLPQFGPSNSQRSNEGGSSSRHVFRGLFWIPVAIYFMNNFYTIAQVEGGSMSPSMAPEINRKDIVLLNKYAAGTENILPGEGIFGLFFSEHSATHKQDLHIGDVIFFISPLDPRQRCTKRILAMPGDIVSTNSSQFPTNSTSAKPSSMIRIPPGHIWVEGDASASEYKEADQNSRVEVPSNRKSRDSRTYGPIPLALVIGRVDCVLVPFSRFGPVPPRPGFDLKRALARRQARERNENMISPRIGTKAHPEDSPVSNYTQWEWYSSDEEDKTIPLSARSSARKSRREEQSKLHRESLGRISRGGQLGNYVEEGED